MSLLSKSKTPRPPKFPVRARIRALRDRKAALIYTHDNPDPDSLAAAWGLARLFRHQLGIDATIAHGGIVGRAQNRAMVEALGLRLTSTETLDPDAYDLIALVDSQPGTGNNSFPAGHRIDVVIDHHPQRAESLAAPWCDIRPDLGATSTIVFQYLRARRVPIDPAMATAFFFALRTETRDLGREATEEERRAYLALVPSVDHALLYRMTHPKVPRAHFSALDGALRSARIIGEIVAVNLDTLDYPDLVAEIADLLLSYDKAKMVLCIGRYEGTAYLSLRNEPTQRRAGALMREIVGAAGTAGGHGTMAGARLSKAIGSAADLEEAFAAIVTRLCESVGQTGATAERLILPPTP
jgi:nanoRNase/pAp phosphatase (c-di-AMP/oligoRNAs hydrolase)